LTEAAAIVTGVADAVYLTSGWTSAYSSETMLCVEMCQRVDENKEANLIKGKPSTGERFQMSEVSGKNMLRL